MARMDRSVAWRAALLQAAAITVVALALGAALPRSFFLEWGWAAGPGAWLACAALTARVLRLPLLPALLGAGLAGLPSLVGVVLDQHWAGAPVGVLLFAVWCGWLAGRRERREAGRTGRRGQARATA